MAHSTSKWTLHPDRFFSPERSIRKIARDLYKPIADAPILSPHGHVDPALFASPTASFGTPADLFIIPDHYVVRLLYSLGHSMESLGFRANGISKSQVVDHRNVWRAFCESFHCFLGTPSGVWLSHELIEVFGIDRKPSSENADYIYDAIQEKLDSPEFSPVALFNRFNIEMLATTDAATDQLEYHRLLHNSQLAGKVIPTFRPDSVTQLDARNWHEAVETLGELTGEDISSYSGFIRALQSRRHFFKQMGAKATDHGVFQPYTCVLPDAHAESIYTRAMGSSLQQGDASLFSAHMLVKMAEMSLEDGLVMQIHSGSYRNHNQPLFDKYGPDTGADIPVRTEFTQNLRQLLNLYGNDPNFNLILFTLDETTYSRELAPLVGHYPALKLGPPWWFHDSLNGMHRYFDQVMETAGLYNTVGFNDDTRALCSIPARHDVWRRACANWVAGLLTRHLVDRSEAMQMMRALTADLARSAYKL